MADLILQTAIIAVSPNIWRAHPNSTKLNEEPMPICIMNSTVRTKTRGDAFKVNVMRNQVG